MQQLTFLNSLNSIESSIEEINGAYESRDRSNNETADRSELKSGLKAVNSIRKWFYKQNGEDFSMPEFNKQKQDFIASKTDPEMVDGIVSAEKSLMEKELKHLESKKYLITDKGIRINLTSKTFKNSIKTISNCIKSL